ncbi:MAG: ubiquinol-cytochrome c reductase iron-sulfur subunit [Flavobacteriaceae bacterium]
MDRKKFVRTLGICVVGIPLASQVLQSCTSIYYANTSEEAGKITVAKSEFLNEKEKRRQFVLVTPRGTDFPISLYKMGEDDYVASLLKCTHRGCELNVGGNIYSCPCHGSEFTTTGEVLEGPAEQQLKTFKTTTDDQNIYIYFS